MNWQPVYALLLLGSTTTTYFYGLLLNKIESKKGRKLLTILNLSLNLGILVIFKYYRFITESVDALLETAHLKMHIPEFSVLLPVGISFYIFQAIGYTIDVHRKDIEPEKDFVLYALFVSFFPQLVAGPIERSTNLIPQFKKKLPLEYLNVIEGLKKMLWGFFMKLVVADRLAIYVNQVYNDQDAYGGVSIWLATFFFSLQLYCDFAGYSNIAIGASRVMGIKLMENFMRPYFFSVSIQDFWKRNHISLTTWLMDYLYYPLIGNSRTIAYWCWCIFLTFIISGIWHGAAWTFVIWGAFHGILLVIEILLQKKRTKFEKKYKLKKKRAYIFVQAVFTYFLICLTSVFFRANSVNDSFAIIRKMFVSIDLSELKSLVDFNILISLLVIIMLFTIEFIEEYKIKNPFLGSKFMLVRWSYYYFLIFCILFLGVFEGPQFIYFQF